MTFMGSGTTRSPPGPTNKHLYQLFSDSPLADLIIRHEEALQAYEQNCDWEDLVNELVHIIDGELKTPDRKSERRALLDDFASH
jgi:translation elongation factor EF-Tu-like GTPase